MLIVVTGPPCAGKSTHIQQHATQGDVIIDLDRLALALGTEDTGSHDYPDHIRHVARKARLAAIDAALPLAITCRVWIIDASPSEQQRTFYRRRNARFVNLTVTPEEMAERLASRPPRNQALVESLTGIKAASL